MLVLSSSVLEQFGGSVFVATTMNKILVVVKYFTTTSSINNPNNIYNVIAFILAHSCEIRADQHLICCAYRPYRSVLLGSSKRSPSLPGIPFPAPPHPVVVVVRQVFLTIVLAGVPAGLVYELRQLSFHRVSLLHIALT